MDRTITTKLVTAVLAIFLLLTIAGQLLREASTLIKQRWR